MKRFYLLLCALSMAVCTFAQGWPERYDGVMLQGFYWDSYDDTNWNKLTSEADELSKYFNLIWIPNSGNTADFYTSHRKTMGYDPCFWLNHNSCWGTETQLRNMINLFHSKGTGFIEDVVINHKNGLNSWVNFPQENVTGTKTGKQYKVEWDNTNYTQICNTDEANRNADSGVKGRIRGAADTGDDFDGFRDLDHTNATTQANVKTYLDFLLNELGYVGFRYDMVKGFKASFVGIYNHAVQPRFSVGEYWDTAKDKVIAWINGTKVNGVVQSAAFDFPLKYGINDAFNSGKWSRLNDACLSNDPNYSRYAVTFVDNHDTGRYTNDDGNAPVYGYVEAANAFILSMPGTPCVFFPHWQRHKKAIKQLILARHIAGINNQSQILFSQAKDEGYVLNVQGSHGKLLLLLGKKVNYPTTDYNFAFKGEGFELYLSKGLDFSELMNINDAAYSFTLPGGLKANKDERCAFFEVPSSWGVPSKISCWNWDKTANYTKGTWPGSDCKLVRLLPNGRRVFKWTMGNNDRKAVSGDNEGIIFSYNNGTKTVQTKDMPFVNGGYYTIEGLQSVVPDVVTSVRNLIADGAETDVRLHGWYTLQGQKLSQKPVQNGVYIHDGKKVLVK